MAIPFLDAETVRARLDYPGCIAAVRDAMAAFSAAGADQPLRQIMPVGPDRLFALMPGMLEEDRGFGVKVITAYGDPARSGRSAHRGVVMLFDPATGEPACLGDAGAITTIRTACASAVATDALARSDARTLAIFGTGALAAAHLHALPLVRRFEDVMIWGRDPARAEALAEQARADGLPARAVTDPRTAATADVLCTVTGATRPVLSGDWVRPGAHVNLVGSSHPGPVECDAALVVRSRYIADSRRSALAAAAEFLDARAAGLIADDHIAAEIGEVLIGRIPGRRDATEVTLYKSLGHIVQDLTALRYLSR